MKKLLLSLLAFVAFAQVNARTIDEVAGYYTETCSLSGDDYYVYSFSNKVDTVAISKIDAATVMITGILGSSEELQGIVDLEANTIIVAPQTILSYYTFSASTAATDPVIINIAEDGTLSFSDAMLTYYGYKYGWDASSTMVRYADNNAQAEFSVPCQIYVIDSEEVIIYQGMTTITKYTEGQYPYVVADYGGNKVLKFYVDEDGQVVTNGQNYNGWNYFWYPYWMGNTDDYLCLNPAESEMEDNGPESGYAVSYGNYIENYDNWDTTTHYVYYYINWGDYIQDLAIESVETDKQQNAPAYRLDGRRADKEAKGLLVRDGKTLFVK